MQNRFIALASQKSMIITTTIDYYLCWFYVA